MNDELDPGHGNSPAAWIAVVIMLIGVIGGTVAFWFAQPLFVWVGVGFVLLGPIVGLILAKAGYGVKGPRYTPKQHS